MTVDGDNGIAVFTSATWTYCTLL